MGSGSTATSGWSCASSLAQFQWVVAPVEKTGFYQDKRAGTDRTKPPSPGALQSEPAQESRFVVKFARAHAPGNQECIDRPAIFPVRPIRMHGRAEMIRNHAVGASGNDVDLVCRIPPRSQFASPKTSAGPNTSRVLIGGTATIRIRSGLRPDERSSA